MEINKKSILVCIWPIYNFYKSEKYRIRRIHESGAITVYNNHKSKWSLFSEKELDHYFKVDIQEERKQKLQKLNESW